VVTGEGQLDASSWSGKVVGGVVAVARRAEVPVLVVVGVLGPGGPRPGLDVEALTDRFGTDRAMADVTACVGQAVREALIGRPGPGPAAGP
jgi:glycerate kinase